MSIPPPLPPGRPGNQHAYPGGAAPPPRQGLSGCAIAAIIGSVAAFFGIFVIAMLAAIALPAYQDYTLRAKVASAESFARSLQGQIDAHRADAGECPDNAAIGLQDPHLVELGRNDDGRPQHASVQVGEVEGGSCAIELTFANAGAKLEGKTELFVSGDGGWDCKGGTLPPNFRSQHCRPEAATDHNTVSP